MELRHLRYFVAVAEELNFRRAAERVYVAQGAFSEQIGKLERELGARLLDRTPRGVSLTSAGASLLPEARRVLHEAEGARSCACDARDRAASHLRIGYVPASLPASVPRAVQRLVSAMPLLETRLEPVLASALIEAIHSGRLDAGVLPMPAPVAGLRTTPLGAQRAVAALPVSHPCATEPDIPLERLACERIVVLARHANRPLYDGILAACGAAGPPPSIVEMPDTDPGRVLLAVASGAGLALLPDCIAERYRTPGVRFVPLRGEAPSFVTAVVTPQADEHLATAAFVRAVSALTHSRAVGSLAPESRTLAVDAQATG